MNSLGAWAVSLVLGEKGDEKRILAALRRHASKNKSNAYMLAMTESESEAISRGDWKAAISAFKQTQDDFHQRSNDAKNAALYVDWVNGEFVAPRERITSEMLAQTQQQNAEFLGFAYNGLRALERLGSSRDKLEPVLSSLVERAEVLRENKDKDVTQAMDALMSEFFEAAKLSLSLQDDSSPSRRREDSGDAKDH